MEYTSRIPLLPGSARLRRRLGWALALSAVALAVAALVVALPSRSPGDVKETFSGGKARVPPTPKHVPLAAADRRAINATLDRFVPLAVERQDPAAAYDLASTGLRSGMTRADWATGTIPVYPYRTKGRRFHFWRLNYSFLGHVSLDLLLPPERDDVGAVAFTIDLVKERGRWLVDSIVPAASFTPVGQKPNIVAQPDLGPYMGTQSHRGRLDAVWLGLPLAILSLTVAAPLALFLVSWRRDRRALAGYHAHLRR